VKRLGLSRILIGLLFSVVSLWAQQAEFRPDYGVLSGRRYMNGYFGFSYRFPEGWNGSALRYPAVGESKMYPLFSANPQAASTSDVRYVSINADYLAPNTTIKAPKDFLELALATQAGPGGEFEALHTDKRYVFGGKQFYRVDMRTRSSPGTPLFYQTLICTIQRGYAITFSFMAANNDDLEDLVRSMESLTFIEPGQLAAPQTEVAGHEQAPPASGSTSGPAATRAPSTFVPANTDGRPGEAAASSQTQPAALPETASAAPETSSATAAPARSTPPPPTTTRKPTAMVSSSTSDVPTAEIPLNQVASNVPVAIEAEVASPAPSAAINTTVPASTGALASAASSSPPSGTATSSAPGRSAAPSTVIPMGRTQQNSYPATQPAPKVQPVSTAAPNNQPLRSETATPSTLSPPPIQPARESVNPTAAPTTLTETSQARLEPAAEVRVSQPTVQPAVEHTPVEAKAAPPPVPPAVSTSGPSALTRVYVPPGELDQYILRKTPPVYPMIAKAAGVGGMVVLDIIVDGKGNLQKVTTINGSALLARAAEEALRQWRFKPYLVDGKPVEMESQVAMNFRLTR
jgi:protein TonB